MNPGGVNIHDTELRRIVSGCEMDKWVDGWHRWMAAPLDGATPCLPLESFANSRLYRPSCHAFGHPLLEGWHRTGAVLRISELDDPSLAPLRPLLSPHRVGSTVADGWHRCGWVAPLRVGGTVAGDSSGASAGAKWKS